MCVPVCVCVCVCVCWAMGQDASQSTHAIWSEKESWEVPAGSGFVMGGEGTG